jgi:hypothetical protein
MSANVFKALGPIGQAMGQIGGAALCGTEFYPVGFSGSELMDLYWMTRYVNATCAAVANAGVESASFPGGVIDGPNVASGDRRNLITNGTWNISMTATTTSGATALSLFNLFIPGQPAPNEYALCYDGSLWYPYILVQGEAIASDGVNSGGVVWDSRTTTNPLLNPGVAVILGKNIPLTYEESLSGLGTASFASPTLTKDSDWSYI